MKKTLMYFLIGFALGAIVAFPLCLHYIKPIDFGTFDLEDYSYELEYYKSDIDLGRISSAKDFQKIALDELKQNRVIPWWDNSLFFDSDYKNWAWLVYTKPKDEHHEKQYYMIIDVYNDKVLAHWSE